jgi:hypothetical protein
MTRNYGYLLALAAAVFFAGCDGDSGAMGDASAPAPAGPAGPADPPGPTGPDGTSEDTDLAAFVRFGMDDPEYGEPRMIDNLNFVVTENPSEFDDWF